MDPITTLIPLIAFIFLLFSTISMISYGLSWYDIITNNKNGFNRFQTGRKFYEELTRFTMLFFCFIGGTWLARRISAESYVTGPFFIEAIALIVGFVGSPSLVDVILREKEKSMIKRADSSAHSLKPGVLGIWPEHSGLPPLSVNEEIKEIGSGVLGWNFTAIVASDYNKKAQITSIELKKQLKMFKKSDVHILHVGAHGAADGVYMYDGLLFLDQFVEYLSKLDLILVVLLVCDGDKIANHLIESKTCRTVVYSAQPLKDSHALLATSYLYPALKDGVSVESALMAAKNQLKVRDIRASHSLRVIGDKNIGFSLNGIIK